MSQDQSTRPGMMPIAHARDALADQVRRFCNEAQARGIVEAKPEHWARRFAAWQEFDDIAERYAADLRSLADHG